MISSRSDRQPLVAPGTIEHHVADLSATFAADVTLAMAQATLGAHQQWLPIDGDPQLPLRTLVERNSTGPLRLGFGAWRDLLLGAQFLNGAGELITAGGRTIKNVAGYDLTKFMVGQFGVFGELVTITTRSYRAPEAALLAAFAPSVEKLAGLLIAPCRPQWAMLMKDALLCGYLGDAATIDFYERSLPPHHPGEIVRHSVDEDIALRGKLWRTDSAADMTFHASVPTSKVLEFASAIAPMPWIADAAFGVVLGSCDVAAQATLQSAVERVGGNVRFFDSAGQPISAVVDPTMKVVLERLKHAFDPEGKLNPLPITIA